MRSRKTSVHEEIRLCYAGQRGGLELTRKKFKEIENSAIQICEFLKELSI